MVPAVMLYSTSAGLRNPVTRVREPVANKKLHKLSVNLTKLTGCCNYNRTGYILFNILVYECELINLILSLGRTSTN